MTDPDNLLADDDPTPVTVQNESGTSPFLIVVDHAGNAMPRALGRLGVPESECERHIAWDIGIASVSDLLADALDATLIKQIYSRLVIDCNRPPGSQTSIPEISELTTIPGNVDLSEAQKTARVREIFHPYHHRIEAELDRRLQSGRPTVLIAMHSFTPIYNAIVRPWQAAVLYHHNPHFSLRLRKLLNQEGFAVGDNQPYCVSDATDYTIPVHGERRGIDHVLLEIRQDLITDHNGQKAWSGLLARALPKAFRELNLAGAITPT